MGWGSLRKQVINPMGQCVRLTASRLIGSIRGKDKVNRSMKSKERGNKPNEPMQQEGQPVGLQAWQEEEQQKQKSNGLDELELLPKQCPVCGGAKGGSASLNILTHSRTRQCKNGRIMRIKEENQRIVERTQRPGHHLLVYSQYRRGEPFVKGFKGCGLTVGRKDVYFEVPIEASFGEMPCQDGISPKRGKHGQGHLMHAIGVSVVRASSSYPSKVRQKWGRGEKQNKDFFFENGEGCSKHILSRGSGRATNELVVKPRELPTRN